VRAASAGRRPCQPASFRFTFALIERHSRRLERASSGSSARSTNYLRWLADCCVTPRPHATARDHTLFSRPAADLANYPVANANSYNNSALRAPRTRDLPCTRYSSTLLANKKHRCLRIYTTTRRNHGQQSSARRISSRHVSCAAETRDLCVACCTWNRAQAPTAAHSKTACCCQRAQHTIVHG
jgi:hypothetical protein